MMASTLLFIVNDPAFFISHRLAIAEKAKKDGYVVHVATMDGVAVKDVVEKGFHHHIIPLSRSGRNLFFEFLTFFSILKLLWRIKPDLLHLVTIKPVIYGGLAARLAPVKGVVAAISGLGFVFLTRGYKAAVLRKLVGFLYRLALGKKNLRVIFQNPGDRDLLLRMGVLCVESVELIRGSGVDLKAYPFVPEPEGSVPIVCLAARLLRDKGVTEFVQAAGLLKQRGVVARFQLVGDPDPGNPATITDAEIAEWEAEGIVEIMGYRKDIASVFAAANLVVLPSYREGLPKVLVEAAACGRAVVTTDVPGCRDAIDPDITGVLVPVRDPLQLANAMDALLKESLRRHRMGAEGRVLAENEFAIEKIVHQHMEIYSKLDRAI